MALSAGFTTRYRIDPDGCWRWIGHISPDGYGRYSTGYPARRDTLAHRIAYAELVGPIPEGMTIDHLCRVRHCVNVLHMEVTTFQVNIDRRDTSNIGIRNRERTHCPQGHPYTEANTRMDVRAGQQHRSCRECHRARQRSLAQRRRCRVAVESGARLEPRPPIVSGVTEAATPGAVDESGAITD